MENKLGLESAFPLMDAEFREIQWGMSRRFYAACAAMQGLLANEQLIIAFSKRFPKEEQYKNILTKYAIMAYEYADELLVQENK